jgi:hypothetical protein
MIESAESFETNTYRRVDVRLLPFLFLCYTLAYLDRVNVGFAKLQMRKDLSLSDAAFAIGAGIFFIGYFFFEVPSNVLLKKFGARTWIARIMISWGVLSTCMTFVKGDLKPACPNQSVVKSRWASVFCNLQRTKRLTLLQNTSASPERDRLFSTVVRAAAARIVPETAVSFCSQPFDAQLSVQQLE